MEHKDDIFCTNYVTLASLDGNQAEILCGSYGIPIFANAIGLSENEVGSSVKVNLILLPRIAEFYDTEDEYYGAGVKRASESLIPIVHAEDGDEEDNEEHLIAMSGRIKGVSLSEDNETYALQVECRHCSFMVIVEKGSADCNPVVDGIIDGIYAVVAAHCRE